MIHWIKASHRMPGWLILIIVLMASAFGGGWLWAARDRGPQTLSHNNYYTIVAWHDRFYLIDARGEMKEVETAAKIQAVLTPGPGTMVVPANAQIFLPSPAETAQK